MANTGATLPPQTIEQTLDKVFAGIENTEVKTNNPRVSTPYQIKYENWYKTIPYALRIVDLNANGELLNQMRFFFPVNPESININTPFAAVVTPTIGGVVQEHSGAVFYNITISGTTGVTPDLDHSTGVPRNPENETRNTASTGSVIPAGIAGGFGASTINAINSAVSAITGTSSKMVDGKRNRTSGYTAFHMLYKFIWLYHFAKSNGAKQQLRFINYKDNNQYDCVVTNFTLSRDKSQPHLYRYSIQLKAWKLNGADSIPGFSTADRLKSLGLDENPSVKAIAFRAINNTKTVLNKAAGLLNAAAQDLAF